MVRGFVRLVAEKHEVILDIKTLDSPAMATIHTPGQKARHRNHKPYYKPKDFLSEDGE